LIHLLISIALSAYLYRIWKFLSVCNTYRSKKILGIPITENSINTIITIVMTTELVINILWDYVSPREPSVFKLLDGERIALCTSVNENVFKNTSALINCLLFFFICYINFKIRKAPEYHFEYKAFLTTAIMLAFIYVAVTACVFLNASRNIMQLVDNSFSFLCGILVLSMLVLPKLKAAITGNKFGQSFAKSYGKSENCSSEASINRILFNDNNVNVISFKDPEDEYDSKFLSEKLITPFDGGYLVNNVKSQRSKNSSVVSLGENNHYYDSNNNNNRYFESTNSSHSNRYFESSTNSNHYFNSSTNSNHYFNSSTNSNHYFNSSTNSSNIPIRNNDIDYLYENVKSYVPKLK